MDECGCYCAYRSFIRGGDSMNITTILVSLGLTLVAAPLVGGFLTGIERKINARLQNRIGPPVLQPFYDVLKLIGKKKQISNKIQIISVYFYLVSAIISLFLIISGQDLLVMIFVLAMGSISFILGAFSVRSPYNQVGAQRELLQVISYEPLLVFYIIGVFLKTDSFLVSSIMKMDQPLLLTMPLFLPALIIVMVIKLRKSPFDIAASHHAHQEIVRGITTELSGRYLALVEITHWFELIIVLMLISLLWATNIWIGIAIALASYFVVSVIDNITARLTWRLMVKFTWIICVPLTIINIAVLYLLKK